MLISITTSVFLTTDHTKNFVFNYCGVTEEVCFFIVEIWVVVCVGSWRSWHIVDRVTTKRRSNHLRSSLHGRRASHNWMRRWHSHAHRDSSSDWLRMRWIVSRRKPRTINRCSCNRCSRRKVLRRSVNRLRMRRKTDNLWSLRPSYESPRRRMIVWNRLLHT